MPAATRRLAIGRPADLQHPSGHPHAGRRGLSSRTIRSKFCGIRPEFVAAGARIPEIYGLSETSYPHFPNFGVAESAYH